MEIEQKQDLEVSPISKEAPEPQVFEPKVEEKAVKEVQADSGVRPYEGEERLDTASLVEKAAKIKKKAEKSEKKAEESPKKDDIPLVKKETKTEENVVKTPETTQEFKPSTKFKALGKEYDLPKWAQEAIKTPEMEKEVKDLFEKTQAFDHIKTRHQELFTKHETLGKDYNELVGGVTELRSIYQDAVNSGNLLHLDGFFEKMKIPREVILNYASQLVDYLQAPPEQKQMLDGQLQASRKAKVMESQASDYESRAIAAESQMRSMQLDSWLAKPEISELVQAFESAPGRKPGDFRERVREHGEYIWFRDKKDLSVEEAVKQVISLYGVSPAQPSAQASAQVAATQQNTQVAQPKAAPVIPAPHRNVPTIPTVSGTSGSPTKTKPKSIEDIRKLYKSSQARA